MTAPGHTPVLLAKVIAALVPADGAIYVDGTFGAGGYSHALLEAADCRVWATDRDLDARPRGDALAADYPGRFTLLSGRFGDLEDLLERRGVRLVQGIALDLGLSSTQIADPGRGFSFAADGPLDMRMGADGESAADLVNRTDETELADIIFRYGEERRSRAVARAIVEARTEHPITRTGELARIVRGVVRRAKDGIDPATRTFQALRIVVNDELAEIDRVLSAAERLLAPAGRLAVVSYHSLEDRRVKNFLFLRAGQVARPSRHQPELATNSPHPSFTLVSRRAIRPDAAEIAANPRARSARLRIAERTAAPSWPTREAA
jgi:16S rRNA (cytosine1402-N4)-methyltransferase